jgi:subtilisin
MRGDVDGRAVKVAVIDSGIGPHPSLNVVDGRNFVASEPAGAWNVDAQQHGTHCAGVVAAAANADSTWGYAPAAQLSSVKVLDAAGLGHAGDIAFAIPWAVENGCDIISMSLAGTTPVGLIQQEIENAAEKGVLCVAAAGNEGGAVRFPARYPYVAAVTAIGQKGIYPQDSIHAAAETDITSPSDERQYLAGFSNRGDDVDFCAPGVAITSTVPERDFAALDGTSMACPHIAGIAALALSKDQQLREMPRDAARYAAVFNRLRRACKDLGLSRSYQGAGLPLVNNL